MTISYTDYKHLMKNISNTQGIFNRHIRSESLLNLLIRYKDDTSIYPHIKYFIMNKSTISIKISKKYITNSNINRLIECDSIYNQIISQYNKNITFINICYLEIFYNSLIFSDLLKCSTFNQKLINLTSYEKMFDYLIYEEKCLEICNIEGLYILINSNYCNWNTLIYNNNLNDITSRIKDHFLKLIYNTIPTKSNIYILKSILKRIAEYFNLDKEYIDKIDEVYIEYYTDYILNIYKKELESDSKINQIINLFNKLMHNTSLQEKINKMKEFNPFLKLKIFREQTSGTRMCVYEHIRSVLATSTNNPCHIQGIIWYVNKIIRIFYEGDSNILIEDLKNKLIEVEGRIRKDTNRKILNCKLLISTNNLLLVDKEVISYIEESKNYININEEKDLIDKEKGYTTGCDNNITKLKTYVKYLNIFISLIDTIDNSEYFLYNKLIQEVFHIINLLYNLRIKHFILSQYHFNLKNMVSDLYKLILQNRLLRLRKTDIRIFLRNNPEYLNDSFIVQIYLERVLYEVEYNIKNNITLNDLYNILNLVFYDTRLFIPSSYILINEIVNSYLFVLENINIIERINSINNIDRLDRVNTINSINTNTKGIKGISNNTSILNTYIKDYKRYKKARRLLQSKSRPFKVNISYSAYPVLKKILSNIYNIFVDKEKPILYYKEIIYVYKISRLLRKPIRIFHKPIKILDKITYLNVNKKYTKYYKIYKKNPMSLLMRKDSLIRFYKRLIYIKRHLLVQYYIELNKDLIVEYKSINKLIKNTRFIKIHTIPISTLSNKHITLLDISDILNHPYISKYIDIDKSLIEILNKYTYGSIRYVLKRYDMAYSKLEDISHRLLYFKYATNNNIDTTNNNMAYSKLEDIINYNKNLLIEYSLELRTIEGIVDTKDCMNRLNILLNHFNILYELSTDILKYNNTSLYKEVKHVIINNNTSQDIINRLVQSNIKYKEEVDRSINNMKLSINKLYFIPHEDIIRLISGTLSYENIIRSVYNIDTLIVDDKIVKGFVSKREVVYFIKQSKGELEADGLEGIELEEVLDNININYLSFTYPSLDDTLSTFINKFDKCLSSTLLDFIHKNKKGISVCDDFINEYRYFNGMSYDTSSKTLYFDRYSTPDKYKLYPKPFITIINGNSKNSSSIHIGSTNNTTNIYNSINRIAYYPPSNILYTNLTNTIFNKISISLLHTNGIILYGESSTGKTETVKYYCRCMGVYVFVLCCSESTTIETLSSVVEGCILNGYYLCLDEFNRLSRPVMSKLSDIIKEKKDIKIRMDKDSSKNVINLDINTTNTYITTYKPFYIFITINKGYLGRNNIPTSFYSSFSEVRVDYPDIQDVIDMYFDNTSSNLFMYLKNNSSTLPHYNFSFRALSTIINNKEGTILNNLLMYYYSMFNKEDKYLFKGNIKDISLENRISLEDIFQYGIKSTGILIYGDSSTGKSTLIRNMINKYKPVYYIFTVWDDSRLYNILKDSAKGEGTNKDSNIYNKNIWIIFDMILESKWIENLNSTLDDNRIFCYQGEVIKVPDRIKFIFESNDISRLTPATLTRVFTIYCDEIREGIKEKDHVIFLSGELGVEREGWCINTIDKDINNLSCVQQYSTIIPSTIPTKLPSYPSIPPSNTNIKISLRNITSLRELDSLVVYLDEYESCTEELYEEIREFYEYRTVKGMNVPFKKLIINHNGLNLLTINHKRRIKAPILEYKIPNEFIEACVLDDSLRNIKYYQYLIYKRLIQYESDFVYKMVTGYKELCIKKKIKFCIKNSIRFILNGRRLSGKRYLLNKVLKEYGTATTNTNILISDDINKLSKEDIKSNILIEMNDTSMYCVSFSKLKEVIRDISNNTSSVYIITTNGNIDIEIETNINTNTNTNIPFSICNNIKTKSCGCCIEEIPHKNIPNTCISLGNLINNIELANLMLDCIHIENIYKLRDFIRTTILTYRRIYTSNKHIHKGLVTLRKIQEQAQEQSFILKETKTKLIEYEYNIKQKIDTIKELDIKIKKEIEDINRKEEELNKTYKIMMNKKDTVLITLEKGKEKIEDSVGKIKSLNKSNLAELKCMNNPPKVVHYLVNVLYNIIHSQYSKESNQWEEDNKERIRKDTASNISTNNINICTKSWSDLRVFLRSNEILRFISNPSVSNIDFSIISSLKLKEKEIYKSSKVCYIFYEWIISTHEYTELVRSIHPLEKEVEGLDSRILSIKDNIQQEIERNKKNTKEIEEYKEEVDRLNKILKDTKKDIVLKDSVYKKIEELSICLSSEMGEWREREVSLQDVVCDWFKDRKTKLISTYNNKEEYTISNNKIIVDINNQSWYKILKYASTYKKDILIKNITQFNTILYKHLKEYSGYNITLYDPYEIYSMIGYLYHNKEKYTLEDDIVKILEEDLLQVVVVEWNEEKDDTSLLRYIDKVLQYKYRLDKERIQRKEAERKKQVYDKLNIVYNNINRIFKEKYKYDLYFGVYDEYIKKNDIIGKILAVKEGDDKDKYTILDKHTIIDNSNSDILDKYTIISSIEDYSLGRYLSIEDIIQYNCSVLIITNNDNIIHFIEKNIPFTSIINIGNTKDDDLSIKIEGMILVKNIDLYHGNINRNNKYIFISEYILDSEIVKECRVICMKYKFDYEMSIEVYKDIFISNNRNSKEEYTTLNSKEDSRIMDLIILHCNIIRNVYKHNLQEKYDFTLKDLELIIKNKDISLEYLKYLVYVNKLDKEDVSKVMDL